LIDLSETTSYFDRIECPGCHARIWSDELCCDACWKRVPLRLRVKLRIKHTRHNWPAYQAAEEEIRKWLQNSG
jgi:hypothetical protein